MRILVTGGAGYIGSNVCSALYRAGHEPIVYDNLSQGHLRNIRWGTCEIGDIRDRARMTEVITKYQPQAIMHLAGLIDVAESIRNPKIYLENNVDGTNEVIRAAKDFGLPIIFSSSCSVYGNNSTGGLFREDHPINPLNPYASSKGVAEMSLKISGAKHVILRYFNVGGAMLQDRLWEDRNNETHLIPLAIRAATSGNVFNIFGNDYPTPDGTAIRDYIHVSDVANAHLSALAYIVGGGISNTFNIGSGRGSTVRSVIRYIEQVAGHKLNIVEQPRREGDACALIADTNKAAMILRWSPQQTLGDIIYGAWFANQSQNSSSRS